MSTLKRYTRFFSKVLLLAGYFFLFATQFNSRFFSIANFFEYRHHSTLSVANSGHGTPPGLGIYNQDHNRGHLVLDKRYSVKHFVKLPFTSFPVESSFEIVAKIYYVPLKVYSSSDLPTNGLRGPPCA